MSNAALNGNALKTVVLTPEVLGGITHTSPRNQVGSAEDSYAKVPLVFRASRIRCNSLLKIPFHLYRDDGTTEAEWPFDYPLRKLIWRTRAAGLLTGAGYVLKRSNRVTVKEVQWLNPTTMRVEWDATNKRRIFYQTINGATFGPWTDEEVVYLPEFTLRDDVGPGDSPASVALNSARLSHYVTRMASTFFESGAMPVTLITSESGFGADSDRVESFFRRAMQGIANAYRVLALRGQGVNIAHLQFPLKDLATPELRESARKDVALAFEIPVTLLDDDANYACLPAGELVYTVNGPKPIERVSVGEMVWTWNKSEISQNPVTAVIKQPIQPDVYRVKTRHRTLRASNNHPLLTVSITAGRGFYDPQQCEYVWKRVDELQTGDYIVVSESLPDVGGDLLPNGRQATPEFMEMAGLYLADGSSSGDRNINFAVPDDAMGQYYQETAGVAFADYPVRAGYSDERALIAKRRSSAFWFSVHCAPLFRDLEEFGLTGRALTKRVPTWVFGLSRDLRLAFLRGFTDGDGTVNKRGEIVIGVANDALAEDLRVLAISCGLTVTNLYTSNRIGNFGRGHLVRFNIHEAEIVGTHTPAYQARIAHPSVAYRLANLIGEQRYKGVVRNLDLAEGTNIERVQSIEYLGKMEVYDLSVAEDHTFIAEGIVVHNTAKEHKRSFYDETVIPDADMFAEEFNVQLLEPLGLRLEFKPEEMDLYQDDERESAQAAATFSGMLNSMADYETFEFVARTYGIEYDEALAKKVFAAKEGRREEMREQVAPQSAQPSLDEDEDTDAQGGDADEDKPNVRFATRNNFPPGKTAITADLAKWERAALKRIKHGGDLGFNSDVIPKTLAAAIHGALEAATGPDEVRGTFANARTWAGYP